MSAGGHVTGNRGGQRGTVAPQVEYIECEGEKVPF